MCRWDKVSIWCLGVEQKQEIKSWEIQEEIFQVFTFQAQRLDRATLEMSPPLDR